jgi:hypothetical protein
MRKRKYLGDMNKTGRIILKWMLMNWDMAEWTSVLERIQGRTFVIGMTNLEVY